MSDRTKKIISVLLVVFVLASTFLLTFTKVLYNLNCMFSDGFCQIPSVTDKKIKIVAIDERTIAELGNPTDWQRDVPGKLIEILNTYEDMRPAVITLDILYPTSKDADKDAYFAEVCANSGNVVVAANTVVRDKVTLTEDNVISVDTENVALVEFPYEALNAAVTCGFANTIQDTDGYIRQGKVSCTYQGEQYASLALASLKKYSEAKGSSYTLPKVYKDNYFYFTFSGKNGGYEVVSMIDIMNGKVDPRAFANCIVMVGAYAPGLMDAFNVAIQRGAQMYGVEIHANILEAIMDGKTQVPVPVLPYAIIVCVICVAYAIFGKKMKILPLTLTFVGLTVLDIIVGIVFYKSGYFIGMADLPVFLVFIYAYHLITGYIAEIIKRRKVLTAFKKYVAPQVVDEISKKGEFKVALGGEKRHIAVLFVDIRGFTPMSEGLKPEEVVEILNEYLNLTTNSIFKNNGTLDKFIGDATMAVFNAPFDLDDYVYRAVCTARDIAAGSAELEEKLMARFGKSVSFGIGVNCGDAVVGNIGCDFRMDYTAIGDTVNTSARLEANAKRGQILISDAVYEIVKDRVKVTEVGVIPLKGKSNDVFVYQLDEVL